MNEFIDNLLGQHGAELWLAGMIWSLIGILAVKIYFLNSKVKFKWKYWFNDNIIDVVKGLVAGLLILRLGDYAIELLKTKAGFEIPESTDFVIYMIVISGALQVYLHKKRKSLSSAVKAEMKAQNRLSTLPGGEPNPEEEEPVN